jgi:large subunit ribosomal protein L10
MRPGLGVRLGVWKAEDHMDNPRPEKVAVVDDVKARMSEADATLLTEYRGLTVKQMADLRSELRKSGADYKIYKNTLVRFAARDLDLSELEAQLTGPTAVAFVKGDAAAAAKALRDFSKANPALVVKGGVLGSKLLTAKDAAALADLPSREVVLAQFAGLLQQPMQQFASLLQALPRNLAYGLKALADKGGANGESASAPAAATDEGPSESAAADEAAAASETSEDTTATAADTSTDSESSES